MKRFLYPLLLLLVSSCVSPESRFVHIHEIDFSGHNDYSVCDLRESSIYVIGYQGEEYWVRYPLGSEKIITLKRALTNREIDSLSLEPGKDSFREDLAAARAMSSSSVPCARTARQRDMAIPVKINRLILSLLFILLVIHPVPGRPHGCNGPVQTCTRLSAS